MYIAYDGMIFDAVKLEGWDKTAEFSEDGVDFLRWRHQIIVTCILNPDLNWAMIDSINQLQYDSMSKAVSEERIRTLPSTGSQRNPVLYSDFYVGQNVGWQNEEPSYFGTSMELAAISTLNTMQMGSQVSSSTLSTFNSIVYVGSDPNNSYGNWTTVRAYDWYSPEGIGHTIGLFPVDTSSIGNIIAQYPGLGPGNISNYGSNASINPVVGSTVLNYTIPTSYNKDPANALAAHLSNYLSTVGSIWGGAPIGQPVPIRTDRSPITPSITSGDFFRKSLPITHNELVTRLSRPRRTLAIWLNSGNNGIPEYMLYLPYPGAETDAMHGPRCTVMSMPAVHGNVTGILKLMFEAWEAPLVGVNGEMIAYAGPAGVSAIHQPRFGLPDQIQSSPGEPIDVSQYGDYLRITPPILSNRWSMRQSPDHETWLNTTIIEGTVHFRMDVLEAKGITADQLRPFIMPPIPYGYVREPPEVSLHSDGASVSYRCIDKQQAINNPGGSRWGVHGVKVHQSYEFSTPIDAFARPDTSELNTASITNQLPSRTQY